ncbi:oligosaccharide flippase family protein [uncultured Maribacter sp.]|uniref:lipopolysaccharide biosynthesis protein n=1 Tax=uncultured Maribacter sp. TaxID=431308 RepID=UPI00261E0BA4|nr:oligosaccharide flippase family protein [uncultured Maribacter sp.]
MVKIKSFIKNNQLVKNIGFLAGGTALAQLITFIVTIYLTRMYLPENFGILSLLTSIVSLLAPVSSLRYDKAIILSEDEREFKSLLYLSGAINIILFFVLFIAGLALWCFSDYLGLNSYKSLFWIIPCSVLFFGFASTFQSYNEKLSKFKLTASISLVDASVKSFLQYVLYGFLPKMGLLLGYLGALFTNFMVYFFNFLSNKKEKTLKVTTKDLKFVSKKYNKFPKYFAWSNMIDSASQNICAITFPFFFSLHILGNFSIAFKVVRLPAMLISMATRRVYYPKAAGLFVNDKANFFKLYKKSTITLILISIIPVILLEFLIPNIFTLFFDKNWMSSIPYAQIILVYVFFNFVNSLAHENMLIFGLQRAFLIIEVIWIVLSVLLIYVAYLCNDAILAVVFYVLSGVIMEITIFIIQYKKGKTLNDLS